MKYFFPPKNQNYTYLQTNRSDLVGSLWSSFNLDFQTNLGAMRLAQKLVINTTSTDDSDLGTPSAFEYWNTKWWAICDTTIFSSASIDVTSAFTEDAGTNAVKTYDFQQSDLGVFDNRLWSTSGGLSPELFSRTATTWTSRDTLGASALHKILYFRNQDRLYYMNTATTICSIDATNAVADPGAEFAIDLGANVVNMTTMVATSSFIFIGAVKGSNSSATEGTYGSIISWDGVGNETTEYVLPVGGALAMVVLNDIPYAIDSEGRILKYLGYGFEEIGRLPVDRTLLIGATSNTGGSTNGRFVHFNGMVATKNNTLLVSIKNLNEDQQADFNENLPSGVWEFDLVTNNFTHKYSFGLKTIVSSTITDYGQNIISRVGALKVNPFATNSATTGRGGFLLGARIFTDATTTKSAIFVDSPSKMVTDTEGQKRGYFVTTWFNSDEIQDKWTRLWTTFRRLLNSTDKIIFKYRLNEEAPLDGISITWTSTTTFTTATDVTAYGPTASGFNGTTGGEVEVMQGTGSGSCTHISNIAGPSGGLYTVTLDNVVTGASGTAKVRFQKWIKLYPEITGQVNSYGSLSINNSNIRIQIKGVMEWTGDDEFYKMAIWTNEDIKINA